MSTTHSAVDPYVAPSAEQAIKIHRGLIHKFVNKYKWACSSSLGLEDLVQAAYLGMQYACEPGRFKPEKGVRFVTYAAICIRQFIVNEIDWNGRTVRIPASEKFRLHRLGKRAQYRTSLSLDTDFAPYNDEAQGAGHQASPLNGLSYEAFDGSQRHDEADRKLAVLRRRVMATMPPGRNRTIVLRYWFDGNVTLVQMGREYGISRERVRQIAERARQMMLEYDAKQMELQE